MKAEDAINDFKEVLVGMGRSDSILWLFTDNCYITLNTVYIKQVFTIDVLEKYIYPIHNKAYKKGLGVNYSCVAEFNGLSLCYPNVPKDEIEMDQSLLSINCKFSTMLRPVNIKLVSPLKFELYKLFKKASSLMDKIPERKDN